MTEKQKELERLYKKYGIEGREPGAAPKPKKKEKGWLQKILDRFLKRKKKPEEPERITPPAGVRTPEQIKEWKEIMRETGGKKKKRTQVSGTRG